MGRCSDPEKTSAGASKGFTCTREELQARDGLEMVYTWEALPNGGRASRIEWKKRPAIKPPRGSLKRRGP